MDISLENYLDIKYYALIPLVGKFVFIRSTNVKFNNFENSSHLECFYDAEYVAEYCEIVLYDDEHSSWFEFSFTRLTEIDLINVRNHCRY